MSDSQLRDRVRDVLNEADASSGSIVAGDDAAAEGGESDLLETAAEASDILESADPDELLAAVGLDTLADGTEPDSIPEAIARGEQENVEDLRRLLRLANLADRAEDGGLDGAIDDLRQTIGERADSGDDAAAGTADGDEADDEPTTGEGEADAAESDAAESGTTDDLGERLRSSMSDSFAEFGDQVSQLKAQLEERSAGTADGEATAESDDGESEAASDEDEEAAADETEKDEDEEAAADEEETGPLGSGLGDEDRTTASGGPSRHSTMAPPPSKRRDMRGTARYSTMPDKYG